MRTLVPTVALLGALAAPALAAGPGQAEAPAAPQPSTPSVTAAPVATAPAATPQAAAPAAPAPKKEAYSSYLALKGGWFGSSGDFQGESFGGSGTWEIAVGTGRTFGVELAGGSMSTEAAGLEIRTIPLLLSLRLQIPIAMVAPWVEAGGGAYFNKASLGSLEVSDVTAGWHAGLGCDVHLDRLLLGAQLRYMGIAPTFSTIGEVTLDRYEVLLRAGLRF